MKFNKDHKVYEISLKPLVKGATIKIEEEGEEWEWRDCNPYTTLTPKRVARIDLSQWEIIQSVNDTENLTKLKELGYKEGAACRILDALGLD